jgi:rare lipoprotein A
MPATARFYRLATFLLACSTGAVGLASLASIARAGAESAGTASAGDASAGDVSAGTKRDAAPQSKHAPAVAPAAKPLDRSGRKRVGKASVYAKKFVGRKMADGTTMHAHGDNAASKTLPLGTTAQVTNLETGKSAVVTIRDRGPYVKGRIIDLSPSTAEKIGIEREDGVSKVEVTPIVVPPRDGGSKPGAEGTDPKVLGKEPKKN